MGTDRTQQTNPEMGLVGRTALVTGAAGGMGRAIAIRLGRAGAAVAVTDLTAEDLKEVASQLRAQGSTALAVAGDVTDRDDVEVIVSRVEADLDAIDIVVNNAGVLKPTTFLSITENEWDWVVDVNLKGTFLCTQATVGKMAIRGWGRVINMSSTAGKNVSTMGGAHYTTAKTAVIGLTRSVAREFADAGVTVNAICPGLFDTDMTRRTISSAEADAYARSFPVPRLGRPEEVAELVVYLASDWAGYITGACLDINGGDLMV